MVRNSRSYWPIKEGVLWFGQCSSFYIWSDMIMEVSWFSLAHYGHRVVLLGASILWNCWCSTKGHKVSAVGDRPTPVRTCFAFSYHHSIETSLKVGQLDNRSLHVWFKKRHTTSPQMYSYQKRKKLNLDLI